MPPARQSIARSCLDAADSGTMTFPEILRTLAAAGFESYSIDFRRHEAVYYATDGESVAFPIRRTHGMVSTTFDGQALQAAIGEAQRNAPGYTYAGFCEKAAAAGCASYAVSLSGRRVLYIGRGAETHVEPFPD